MKKLTEKFPPAIFLMGPTASGKTALAIELVQKFPLEIISVDSAMVYRGMDIGTGKPTEQELVLAPHHLINIKDPSESYSAAEFARDALALMADITARDRIPLLVGGTFLYFKALQEGLSPLPSADPAIRMKLLAEAETLGWTAMHDRLKALDKQAADRIHPNDPQRIQRALEVYEITGKTMSELFLEQKITNESNPIFPYQVKAFALVPEDREYLRFRIAKRFHSMLSCGLIDEVGELYKRHDLHLDMPSMRAVGYRQIIDYLAGHYDYDEMVKRAIYSTQQLAKRQLTWQRSLKNIQHLKFTENNHLDLLPTMVNCVFS